MANHNKQIPNAKQFTNTNEQATNVLVIVICRLFGICDL